MIMTIFFILKRYKYIFEKDFLNYSSTKKISGPLWLVVVNVFSLNRVFKLGKNYILHNYSTIVTLYRQTSIKYLLSKTNFLPNWSSQIFFAIPFFFNVTRNLCGPTTIFLYPFFIIFQLISQNKIK